MNLLVKKILFYEYLDDPSFMLVKATDLLEFPYSMI